MEHSLADRIPFWHFDQKRAIFWDGSLGAGFRLEGRDISCSSIESINLFSEQLENLLKSVDEEMRVQVYYRLTPNAKGLIQAHGDISKDCKSEDKELRQDRLGHLGRLAANNMWFMPEAYLFLRTPAHAKKHFIPLPASEFEKKRELFEREAHSLESALVHAGLKPLRLSGDEWFRLLFEHFNPDRSELMSPAKIERKRGAIFRIFGFSGYRH